MKHMQKEPNQLPKVAFSILLALSLRERHGYEIIKQVNEDSGGKIKLGPGALYTSIKHLREKALIIEISHADDSRRRYYKMTAGGRQALESELEYYQKALVLAHQRRLIQLNNHA